MKKQILITAILALTVLTTNAQCLTREYISIANKVFTGNLKDSDFAGTLFVTIDTTNSESLAVASNYFECKTPAEAIKIFTRTMASIKVDGNFFNYYEQINNSFYRVRLHQSFLMNTANYTYKVDIWNNAQDITKIEGLTIMRYNEKLERVNE